jgi:hypothetical protein
VTVRPDIAALIAAGHTDTGIAARLDIDRTTANKARHELRRRSQQTAVPEATPTGRALKRRDWTPEEQARHRAELLAALADTAAARRHLRAVPPPTAA